MIFIFNNLQLFKLNLLIQHFILIKLYFLHLKENKYQLLCPYFIRCYIVQLVTMKFSKRFDKDNK